MLKLDSLKDDLRRIRSPRADAVDDLAERLDQVDIGSFDKDRIKLVEKTLADCQACQEKYEREKTVLKSFKFETMFHRYEAIAEAHQKTFEWIFKPASFPSTDPRSKITFKEWLQSGDGVYWIAGKPGSGKSTLMKYLADSHETKNCLLSWAGDARLGTATFYFWGPGTELQRTQKGLFRQILFDLLREYPDLIPVLCQEDLWNPDRYYRPKAWKLSQLKNHLLRLEKVSSNTKICFFIDGLDEYDGEHLDLIQVITKLAKIPSIKICVSSRRWPCFEDSFGAKIDCKLYLEDLTRDDIARFARDKMEEALQFQNYIRQSQEYLDLVAEITRKAQGVFLWVFLVVRSLRDGLTNGDGVHLLRERLDEIPSDLEEFFRKILLSVHNIYRRQMAVTFQVALQAPGPINVLTYWLLEEECRPNRNLCLRSRISKRDLISLEEEMIRRLNGRYKGLLEAVGRPGQRRVDFLHRTVRDYLETTSCRALLLLPNLNTFSRICRALALYVSSYIPTTAYSHASLEYFVIFARQADIQKESFNLSLIHNMNQAASETFEKKEILLQEMVRFGFVQGLRFLLSEDSALLERHGHLLLKTALEVQSETARKISGIDAAVETLDWLLRHGGPSLQRVMDRHFPDFLLSGHLEDYDDIEDANSAPHMPYDIWNKMLLTILRYGSNIHRAFRDSILVRELPFFASDTPFYFFTRDALNGKQTNEERLETRNKLQHFLDRLLDTYSSLLRYGLDPNMLVHVSKTIWQAWLWRICDIQTSHGMFEDACVKAMKLFLSNGANPYEVVYFESELVDDARLSVSSIAENFFEEKNRLELATTLDSAMSRCQHAYSQEERIPGQADIFSTVHYLPDSGARPVLFSQEEYDSRGNKRSFEALRSPSTAPSRDSRQRKSWRYRNREIL